MSWLYTWHVFTCMLIYIYICSYTYIYIHLCMCVNTYEHAYIYMYVHIYLFPIYIYIHTYLHIYTHISISASTECPHVPILVKIAPDLRYWPHTSFEDLTLHLRPVDMCVERGEETQKNQGERVGRKCARLGVFVWGRGIDLNPKYQASIEARRCACMCVCWWLCVRERISALKFRP